MANENPLRLPQCPKQLDELDPVLHSLARVWSESSNRPQIERTILSKWDFLVREWANDESLPLYVRKKSNDFVRGEERRHSARRLLVPTDNSPAHWSFMWAFRKECPELKDVAAEIKGDRIPVMMILKKAEKDKAKYKCTLASKKETPNALGWKICHIDKVGDHLNQAIEEMDINILKQHFVRFLAPSNMFLVPKSMAGLGELNHFTEIMRRDVKRLGN